MAIIEQVKSIPTGEYMAAVLSADVEAGQYGPQVRFNFQIEDGPAAGQLVTAWASARFSSTAKLYRWAAALFGQSIPGDYDLDTDHLIGRRCRLTVVEKERPDGSTFAKVEAVRAVAATLPLPLPLAPAPAATPAPFRASAPASAPAPFRAPFRVEDDEVPF
jgi:hypothetical protein